MCLEGLQDIDRAHDLLCRCRVSLSSFGTMDKPMVKFAKDGDPSLLIWKVPPEFIDDGSEGVQIFALPLLSRPGGILFAVPDKVLSTNLLLDAMLRDEASTLGPSREFAAQLIVEGESGAGVVDLPNSVNFLALDLEDSVLSDMREYDVLADMSEIIVPFLPRSPTRSQS